MSTKISFINTRPVKISKLQNEIREIEQSGIYSNYGPVNTRFEDRITQEIFYKEGACVTNCNATIGLMLAIREAVHSAKRRGRYALMPSFTFAATAHAALWAGLTPLLCDIDPDGWSLSANHERDLIERYGDEIAVIVPYATFGANIDLEHYDRMFAELGIPTVVDAAASLGSLDNYNKSFGCNFNQSVVYSMHVTKTFSTYEGGLIYSRDTDKIRRLRAMGNFGFETPRSASLPGLNSKLSEIGALAALKKLDQFESIVQVRSEKAALYKEILSDFGFQVHTGKRTAYQFMPVLLDQKLSRHRTEIAEKMNEQGIVIASYFSPHLAEQPYFRETCQIESLEATNNIARRIISLPLYEALTDREVMRVSNTLKTIVSQIKL